MIGRYLLIFSLAGIAVGQNVVKNHSATQSISQAFGTTFNVNRQGTIRFADQFSGSDECAKIAAAISDLPATGGTVDARSLEGSQFCASNPFGSSTKPVTVLLGSVTLYLSVQIANNTPSSGTTAIVGLGEATNIVLQNSAAFIQPTNNTEIRDLMISSSLTSVNFYGSIYSQATSNVSIENVTFVGGGTS